MTYSCTDFTDTILDALNINVPEESYDSPEDQADLALEEIERMRNQIGDMRLALQTARSQIKTLGTPDDAYNNAILAIIDKAIA